MTLLTNGLLPIPTSPIRPITQVEDPSLRLRFLRNAESLSLLLGLIGDAGLKASRWWGMGAPVPSLPPMHA